jgi:hypothetical protein
MTTTDTKPATPNSCGCGCGAEVKGRYRPGHDARHASDLAARYLEAKGPAKAKVRKEIDALSDKLRAKTEGMIEIRTAKAAAKAEKAKAKAAKPKESIRVSTDD